MRAHMKRTLIVIALLLVSACGTSPQRAQSGTPQQDAPRLRPTLTTAITREPGTLFNILATATESSGGLRMLKRLSHSQLVVLDERNVYVPQLAAEQISTEGGTWRVNADGTMDTVWRLKPNVRWHDGTPFTADDLTFSFAVYKDGSIPTKNGAVFKLMESAEALDPLTLVVHWSSTYAFANEDPPLEPLPRHLLEPLYLIDKANLTNSSLFREDFVGLGAYRLQSWDRGSHLEYAPFDDYFQGRPALGKVIVRVIPDVTTMVASMLAGELDVLTNVGISVEQAQEVQGWWQGTGNQVFYVPSDNPFGLRIQHRPEFARPIDGLTVRAVRQALLHAIDRESIVHITTGGMGAIADSWLEASGELRDQLGSSIPQYPYDPARAQQLLADAGWSRDSTGTLINQRSGEPFAIEARFSDDAESEKTMTIVANNWSVLGARVSLSELVGVLKSDPEYLGKASGVHGNVSISFPPDLHSQRMASAANRWQGGLSGYANPAVDVLLDRYAVTISRAESLAIHRELLRLAIGDVAGYFPVLFKVEGVLALAGIGPIKGRHAWNVFEWSKQ